MKCIIVKLAYAILNHDRRKLKKGKPAPVRKWAIALLVYGAA